MIVRFSLHPPGDFAFVFSLQIGLAESSFFVGLFWALPGCAYRILLIIVAFAMSDMSVILWFLEF